MTPARLLFQVTLSTALALSAAAQSTVTFKPLRAQAGQSIELITRTKTNGGTIRRQSVSRSESGTIDITRDRHIIWTMRDPLPDGTIRGMVRVPSISTTTVTRIGGKEERNTAESPLSGKMFSMSKTPMGDWKFKLDGSVPHARMRTEIDSIKLYLKRKWFPIREVKLGDSWEFEPNWINTLIRKDLPDAKTVGTMKLRQIRRSSEHEIAIIDVSVNSTGSTFSSDGTATEGSVSLSGELVVNLRTMLDESIVLKGTIQSTSGTATQRTTVNLPIEIDAKKSFVRTTIP